MNALRAALPLRFLTILLIGNLVRVGDLVCSRRDSSALGIVLDIDPMETCVDHPGSVCVIFWFSSKHRALFEKSHEFKKTLEVVNENR